MHRHRRPAVPLNPTGETESQPTGCSRRWGIATPAHSSSCFVLILRACLLSVSVALSVSVLCSSCIFDIHNVYISVSRDVLYVSMLLLYVVCHKSHMWHVLYVCARTTYYIHAYTWVTTNILSGCQRCVAAGWMAAAAALELTSISTTPRRHPHTLTLDPGGQEAPAGGRTSNRAAYVTPSSRSGIPAHCVR